MSKPTPLSGFPELLPEERFVEQQVIDLLRRTFELHGFAGIETRAVEPVETLLGKGETSKEIYLLERLQAEQAGTDAGVGLHFDLTVPFARYVLEHAGKLEFPFRRYQIQKAWRGERPQEGRYREFTQADIDVVMKDELPFHADIEVARVMAEALAHLPLPPMRLRVNNRKLIEGFYRGIGAEEPQSVIRIIDKLDKLSAEQVSALLTSEAGLSEAQAAQCLSLARISTSDSSFVEQVRGLGVDNDLLETGLTELAAVIDGCADLVTDRFGIEASLSLARGLDYYTGTVFEIFMVGFEFLKSVGGGGRYDALASDGKSTYPGVGMSFGISRTLVPLMSRGLLSADRKVPSVVLVALVDEESRASSDAIATQLRANGVPCEVAASAQRFGKQIRYAERRGIPYVWFTNAEGGHEVKDIRTGDQVAADPTAWTPPERDLRPSVVLSP
ncbi:histidine--tRNA ligase [Nocardioides sp.]|uniref:histidine--tRNA ligase n=1 Tax=Nocardioides sp. TaxID=35761 RepID=UPI003D0D2774